MRLLILVTLLLTSNRVVAGDPKYSAATISEDLKKGMYAVVRDYDSKFYINSRNSSSHHVKKIITILNGKAKSYATLSLHYDKQTKIENLKATVYDAQGNVVRKLKASDIIDQSAISNFSLYEDSRLKHFDLAQSSYPYTIEYEYIITMRYLYALPSFYLYTDDEISTEQSSYSIYFPKELKPRYKLFNIEEPKTGLLDKHEFLSWSFKNVKPEKFERQSPTTARIIPHILAAPTDFEYGGYAGKMDTWENLGKWQIALNEGRGVLPEPTKQKVKEITAGKNTRDEKIKALYEYLQNKTRYVSIQLGIGGLQPFDAKTVDQLGYGDCKALSNYMVALLKEIDVKAYYTKVYGGDDDRTVPADFTMPCFNHIIVAVPNETDTTWLECTSQTKPYGFLGSFTSDRYALMITDEGGALVKTPRYTVDQNLQTRNANVVIDRNGDAMANVTTTYTGLQYENGGLYHYINLGVDEQRKWLQKNTSIPSFDLGSFSITNQKEKIPSAIVAANYTLKRFASVSGKRIFITPNMMNRTTFVPDKLDSRKTPIVINMSYTDLDTITYQLPEGIYPEYILEPMVIKSKFGEYEASFKVEQEKLIYIRKMTMQKGEFPAELYPEFVEFYKSVNKADNAKLVFLSKT